MRRGRKRKADPGMLHGLAQQLYADFVSLSEGRWKWFLEKEKHQQLNQQIESAELQLTEGQKARAVEVADEEVRRGKIQESDRTNRIREIEEKQLPVTRDHLFLAAPLEIGRAVRVRGQPELIEVLLNRGIPSEQIRELCKDAFMRRTVTLGSEIREVEVPAWPISMGSMLPACLTKFSDHYVGALNDPRFPGCDVTTSNESLETVLVSGPSSCRCSMWSKDPYSSKSGWLAEAGGNVS